MPARPRAARKRRARLHGHGSAGARRLVRSGAYEPLLGQVRTRLASNSEAVRARIGAPERESYGPTEPRGWTSIAPGRPTRRFSFSSTAARGSAARRRIPAIRLRCSSMPGRITSRSTSSRSGGRRRSWRNGEAGTQRRRLGPQECSEASAATRRGSTSVAIPRWASLRRGAGHRLAEGIWAAAGQHQRRAVYERHVRDEARAALGASQLREVHRCDGGCDERHTPYRPGCMRLSPSPMARSRRPTSSARPANSPPRSRRPASRQSSSKRRTTRTSKWANCSAIPGPTDALRSLS